MSKIKSVSQFEDNIWSEATPIGADASNIDVEMSDSSTKDLQTVLGDIPSAAAPIQSQINTKVTASGGNIGNTTVSSGIQNFDSSSSETSTELLDTSVRVTNATEVTSSMWTKFNRFRKRVDNKFKDVFLSSVEDVASPSLTKTYSQSALNDYFANVVGYATAADLPDASSTIASQLSTLNNNIGKIQTNILYNTWGDASLATWNFISGTTSLGWDLIIILFHDEDSRIGSIITNSNYRANIPLSTVRSDMQSGVLYFKTRIVHLYDTYMQNVSDTSAYQTNINAYFSTTAQSVIHKSCVAPHYIVGINTFN